MTRRLAPLLRSRPFALVALLAGCSGPVSGGDGTPPRADFGDGPATDFYTWVNADWMAANPVPEAYGSWGAFHEIHARNEDILHEVMQQAAAGADPTGDSVEDRLGTFWQSGMDVETLQRLGARPLEAELARIAAIDDRAELPAHFARLALLGVPVAFGVQSESDLDDSSQVVLWAMQAGWGLPEKGYYTRTDDQTEKLRIQYGMHIAKLLTLLGDAPSDAVDAADAVLALERRLAEAGLSAEELRVPDNYRNPMAFEDAQRLTPAFDWSAYFDALGVPLPESMNMPGPAYFERFDRLYSDHPLEHWKALLRYQLARRAAPYLSDEFAEVEWEFYAQALQGVQAMKPRWQRVLDAAEDAMGEGVGRLFVARAFPAESKATADRMVDDLFAAFRSSLAELEWMSPETRAQAIAKLDAMDRKIGHPDAWEDYAGLRFAPDAYLRNAWAAAEWQLRADLAEVGGAADPDAWEMDPHQVNAYYNPLQNEIVFPAGILQPPFFSAAQDDAANYGAMGAVIGHEITHGFDDMGSRFDADGNLRDWWSEEDRSAFEARAAGLVAQFDAAEAMDGLPVNGTLTLGENIADLGGVKMAWLAFQRTDPGEAPGADGLTPAQRFFASWARAWRWNVRPERLKLLVQTDPHAPNPLRANLPLGHLRAYAEAFGLDDSAPMVRSAEERISIW